jgi:glycosyltransferase involved in cell wall biosynthesis
MPLPKVCVLCVIPHLGGAEISLLELVARLQDRFEFHLIVPANGPLQERAEQSGAKVWLLPWPDAVSRTGETTVRSGAGQLLRSLPGLRSFTRRLERLLEEIGPSVLITNAVKAHIIGAIARRRRDVPLVWYMRDGLEQRVVSRKLLALLSRRCDLAVCISQYVAGQVRRYVSASVPAAVVYNIVDLDCFMPGLAAPVDLPKTSGEIWFGTIGAITPLKGLDIFLDAAQRVSRHLPNARFVIVGMNPYLTQAGSDYEAQLRHRVETSSLRDRVKFLGFRKDIASVLGQLDVLVQPNRGPEGLGRSVLEAMASGVPVVAVNQWGPAELIQSGETGLLFPPLDTAALAAHMLTLGTDIPLRTNLGQCARAWIHQSLVPETLARQFQAVLSGVISPRQNEAMSA